MFALQRGMVATKRMMKVQRVIFKTSYQKEYSSLFSQQFKHKTFTTPSVRRSFSSTKKFLFAFQNYHILTFLFLNKITRYKSIIETYLFRLIVTIYKVHRNLTYI